MKNQYFGDINDYKKYSLLRHLSGNGRIKTVVCWVLTQDDSRTDGSRIEYLAKPDRWRSYDPVVYEHLREHVMRQGRRDVSTIEQAGILPNCRFYREYVHDDVGSRDGFFSAFSSFARGADLVFFDPDNGFEVKSVPRGKKKSSKYIYWSELEASYRSGHSLLLYQHLPRRPRESFIGSLVRRFKALDGIRSVYSFCTSHVAFLLVPQPHHESVFVDNTAMVSKSWGDVIRVNRHSVMAYL